MALHEQVLVLRQQLRDPIGLAQSLVNLGKAVQHTGDLVRARALLEDGLARLRRLGIERDTGACLYNLALVARAEGGAAEAAQLAGESLAIKHSAGEWFDVAQCLELLAGLAADRGLGMRAARLLGASSALRRSIGARPSTDESEASATYKTVRDALGRDGLAVGIAEGEAWPLERTIAEATEIALVSSSAPPSHGFPPPAIGGAHARGAASRPHRPRARGAGIPGPAVHRPGDRRRPDDQPQNGDDPRRTDPHQARCRGTQAGRHARRRASDCSPPDRHPEIRRFCGRRERTRSFIITTTAWRVRATRTWEMDQ